jgi:hypothetical protein
MIKLKKFKQHKKNLVENQNIHNTHIINMGCVKLVDPQYGDFKLSVMPFENTGEWVSLPEGFKIWEESFNQILKIIPLQENANTHYITIDTKFFTTDEFLRREGVHVDGNFCVDPNFTKLNECKSSWGGAEPNPYEEDEEDDEEDEDTYKSSWGGSKPSWGGARYDSKNFKLEAKEDNSHVKMDWVLPYKIVIPVADYISEKKGGILTVSTEVGCQAWDGTFYGEILDEGSFELMESQLTENRKKIFEKDQLYFMTSNTPHETLLIKKGKRRTFLRITLNHNYLNESILSKFK